MKRQPDYTFEIAVLIVIVMFIMQLQLLRQIKNVLEYHRQIEVQEIIQRIEVKDRM